MPGFQITTAFGWMNGNIEKNKFPLAAPYTFRLHEMDREPLGLPDDCIEKVDNRMHILASAEQLIEHVYLMLCGCRFMQARASPSRRETLSPYPAHTARWFRPCQDMSNTLQLYEI